LGIRKRLLCEEAVSFDRFGEPRQGEPDILFSGSSSLGIEITMAFYLGDPDDPNLQAREDWRFARNPQFDENGIHRTIDPKTGRPRTWDRMVERLTATCQNALDRKCARRYSGVQRLWLGIYGNAPVTDSLEFDEVVDRLSIPESNPFERIFILHVTVERGGGYRALQLFPKKAQYLSSEDL
jgi:hypothetical protein